MILGTMLLVGCSKTAKPVETPLPTDSATNSGQVDAPKNIVIPPIPTVSPQKDKSENQPTANDLETLTKKLDATKDQKEREKILADIQKILDQVEQNAPN